MLVEPIKLRDHLVPPRIGSYVFWKHIIEGKVPEYAHIGKALRDWGFILGKSTHADLMDFMGAHKHSGCAFCGDAGARMEDDVGYYYCLCWLLEQEDSLSLAVDTWSSAWAPKSLDVLDPVVGNLDENTLMEDAINAVGVWTDNPEGCLVLSGPVGTGKSHMLKSIMKAWHPWAMYVVASDFKERLFEYFQGDSSKITAYTKALKYHPMLVIDDLGIEYENTKWIAAEFDALIEFRLREDHYRNFPTAIATNIKRKNLKVTFQRNGVPRTGSRLTDANIVRWYSLTGRDFRGEERHG